VRLFNRLASVVLIVVAPVGSRTVLAQTTPADSFACNRQCLSTAMDDFVKAATTGRAGSIAIVDHAEIRENAVIVPIDNTPWARVKTVRSIVSIADVSTGNVVSRAGVELIDGTPGYLSTRLKVVRGGRVMDVEISADTSPRVVSSYVWKLDPSFTTVHSVVLADFETNCTATTAVSRSPIWLAARWREGRQEHALAPWRAPRLGGRPLNSVFRSSIQSVVSSSR